MERCVVWIFTLYLFLTNYLIFTSANDIYCTTKNQQSRTCHRMCHCARNTDCPRNGKCNSTCSSSWMGEFCQYRNIADGITPKSNNKITVNLLVSYPVSALRFVSNYTKDYAPLFANITIAVKNKTHGDRNEGNICFSEEIKITSISQSIFCSTIWLGNEIHIYMSNHMDKISNIQVYGGRNVVLWKDATQSSTKSGGTASRAVDGNDGSHQFGSNSCTHTEQESHPKWNVDLDQPYMVTWIQIDNRDDGLGRRLNGFKVATTDEEPNKIFYNDSTYFGNDPGNTIYIAPNNSGLPAVFQNLTIFKTGQNRNTDDDALTLCEVSLYACRPSKVGENCFSLCPQNCNLNETCPNYECPSCKPGWDGNHCNTVKAGTAFCTEAQKRVCDRSPNCSSCKSLCHCRDGQECDPMSGHCSNGCDEGWIGEDCQYSNIAHNISWISVAQQGGQATRGLHNATINLNQDYPITALHIVTKCTREASVPYIKAIFVSSRGVKSECESNLTAETNDIIVYCPYILKGKTIQVISNTSEIYKVDIFGGRNIALWGNADQSSTYGSVDVSWPARFAVDGIATTDFDSMPRSCSHTWPYDRQRAFWELSFEDVVFITRMKLFLRSSTPRRNQGIEIQLIDKDNGRISVYNTSTDSPKTVIELVHPAFIRKVTIHGGKPTQNYENILQICELQVFGCPYKGCDQLLKNCKKTIDNIDEDFNCKKCMAGWEGPFCNIRKKCKITDVEHLRITTREKRNFYVNESISFVCDTGYDLVGDSNLTCQENKTWSYHFPSCMAVNCTSPSQSSASHLQDGTGWTKTYHFGDNVTLSCDEGYQVFGHRNISCNEMGRWTPAFPTCKAINCTSLPLSSVPHLRDFRRWNHTYHFGEIVNLTCDEGYQLHGHQSISCDKYGNWTKDFPVCTAINCTSLPLSSVPHLRDFRRWNYTYHFGEIVNLTCNEGYQLHGQQSISCDKYGNWTKDFPVCTVVESEASTDAQGALPIPAIAGGGAAFLIVILVIVITIVFVRRRRQPNNKRAYQEPTPNLPDQNVYAEIDKTREKKERKTTKDDGAGYYNLNAIDPSTARTARNEVYYDFTIPKKPSQFAVKVTDFIDYVDERKHQNDAFGLEFRKLKSGLQFPTTFAMRSKNTQKNKYRNIYPYDDSRVVLSSIEGKQDSDYINASYIHGSFEVKHYIAAQGPLQETLEDFWRMIWQEDIGKITMLTKLSEGRKVKCAQYWPEAGDPMEMGEITVKLIDTETFADFEIRTISVTKGKDNRNVIQFHFTSWPDKGIPTYASSLVHFRAKVLNTHSSRSGPILVHCSAGIGRTGTFIALDFLLQQAKDTGYVDVFTCVEMLRRQRVNMVQTQEQYIFVHVALLEALMTPSSAIGASDFPQHYRELLEYDGDTKTLKLENELNTLNRTSPEIDDADFSQGKSSSRRKKNRYSNIIPVNGEMPIITPSSSEDQYINAVYLPAYREKNNFIITQMPLTNTIIDFWRLIHHQKVSTIVMLNTLDTKDENDLGVYWPKENGSETFGDFKVDIVNTSVDEDGDMEIVNLSYTYKEQEPRTVRLFKAIFWPEDMTTPSSIRAFLKLIDTANLHHQRTKSTPIIVHCINGCEKSGLYCVLQVVIERLKLDQDVGIQQIIKQMRSRRPQIIPNFEQFQFCHDVVIEFMKQYDAYSNFQ